MILDPVRWVRGFLGLAPGRHRLTAPDPEPEPDPDAAFWSDDQPDAGPWPLPDDSPDWRPRPTALVALNAADDDTQCLPVLPALVREQLGYPTVDKYLAAMR